MSPFTLAAARYRKAGARRWSLALVPPEGGRAALEAALGGPVVAYEPVPPPEPEATPADADALRPAPEPPPAPVPQPAEEWPEPAVALPADWLAPAPPHHAPTGAAPPPPPRPPPPASTTAAWSFLP